MNDQQKQWQRQFWNNFSATGCIRLYCVIALWVLLGIGLSDVFHSNWILLVFTALLMIFSLFSLVWKPTYLIYRKILGSPNLPTEPIPFRRKKAPGPISRQPIPWLYYVPTILMAVVTTIITWVVLYLMFTRLMK